MIAQQRFTPEGGDLVIRPDVRDGQRVYVLHTVLGVDQYLIRSRDEAVAQAMRFATRLRVRVWLTNDDDRYALVQDLRAGQ